MTCNTINEVVKRLQLIRSCNDCNDERCWLCESCKSALNTALEALTEAKKLKWRYACGIWDAINYEIRVNEDGTYSWRIKGDDSNTWNHCALDLYEAKQQCQSHADARQPDGREALRRVRTEIADTLADDPSPCGHCRKKALEICDRELGAA